MATTAPVAIRLLLVLLNMDVLLTDNFVPEPDDNCALWIQPPAGVPEAFPIGLGRKAVCGVNSTQPTTCPDERTCQEECVNLRGIQHCWCDEGCDDYGDCGRDSPRNVCYRTGPPFPTGHPVTGAGVPPARRAREECVRTWITNVLERGGVPVRAEYGGHWLEAGCPPGYRNKEIESKCISEQGTLIGNLTLNNTDHMIHSVPVTGRLDNEWRHFKNVYCAFCQGVKLQDMLPWNLSKIHCTELHLISPGLPPVLVDQDCVKFAYRFDPSCPTDDAGAPFKQARVCKPDLVEDCPDELEMNATEAWAADLCKSYMALIQCDVRWYKNPHCCVCHGHKTSKFCYKPNTIPGSASTPISIPFDFLPLADDAIDSVALYLECPHGFNFSFNAQKCIPAGEVRALYCDKALPVVQAKVLVSVEKTASSDNSWLQVFVSLFEESMFLDRYQTTIANLDYKLQTSEGEQPAPRSQQGFDGFLWELSFDTSNISTVWEQFNNLSDEMTAMELALVNNTPSIELLQMKLTEICSGEDTLDRCTEQTFDPNEVTLYVFGGVKYIHHDDELVLYRADSLILRVEYSLESRSPNVWEVYRELIICNATKDLLCHYITLRPSEYRIDEDGAMRFNVEGRHYESTDYLILTDDSAQVCKDNFQDLWFDYSLPQYILNVVGTTLSSLALVLTFITYCAFSNLRTVPGCATMHFVVALFAGEILLLVGGSSGIRESHGACTFMAVICHYIWMACFFWMTALGFDVSRTFSMTTGPRLVEKSGHALLWMCAFAWGMPAVIIAVCLPLHFVYSSTSSLGGIEFNYGLGGVCWIRPEMANLLAFGLPVLASLLINAALFVKTIVGLRESKKITSFIEKDKSAMQRASDEFFIYLKVSVLMGLTWIWFFIAAFTRETAIYYVAIILNAFHGCFVFVAFVCNRRVWAMWRRKIGGKRGAGTSSSSRSRSGTISTGKVGGSLGTNMTKSSSVVTSESPVSGSPVPERIGLNGTQL
ncbi:uncharacterized protein LOC110985775 [Acanthaster planci]|uniref:Uncharacterized protein LOC110985775 n=1 Tax=Acanthaster planci TaxID=133434 RepID=A0A8B7ZAR3_ACAPL|nr:uncharacterized protein LOC110985775 [Acanthaster planci]